MKDLRENCVSICNKRLGLLHEVEMDRAYLASHQNDGSKMFGRSMRCYGIDGPSEIYEFIHGGGASLNGVDIMPSIIP